MEIKDIYALWDRFEKGSAAEFELDFQGVHLKLVKGAGRQIARSEDMNASADSSSDTVFSEKALEKKDRKAIKAPLVGVFYKAPAPGEAPFVTPGSSVKKGDIIGIIEAMKAMNEITAPEDGIVEEIMVGDAQMVQYDEPILFYQ